MHLMNKILREGTDHSFSILMIIGLVIKGTEARNQEIAS